MGDTSEQVSEAGRPSAPFNSPQLGALRPPCFGLYYS